MRNRHLPPPVAGLIAVLMVAGAHGTAAGPGRDRYQVLNNRTEVVSLLLAAPPRWRSLTWLSQEVQLPWPASLTAS